jgi:hypothetical protein
VYPTILFIGHSTHTEEAFIALLRNNGVERLEFTSAGPGKKKEPVGNGPFFFKSLVALSSYWFALR